MKTIVVILFFLHFTLTGFAAVGQFDSSSSSIVKVANLKLLAANDDGVSVQATQNSELPPKIFVIGACLLTNVAILIATLFLWRLFKDDTIEFRRKNAGHNL